MQHNYVIMRLTEMNMQDIFMLTCNVGYVVCQHNYPAGQHNYGACQQNMSA